MELATYFLPRLIFFLAAPAQGPNPGSALGVLTPAAEERGCRPAASPRRGKDECCLNVAFVLGRSEGGGCGGGAGAACQLRDIQEPENQSGIRFKPCHNEHH